MENGLMQKMTVNELMHDGMRRMKVIGDGAINADEYMQLVPPEARGRAVVSSGRDELLGLHSLDLRWPVFEPFEFFIHGPRKFRRLMVVHYGYGSRVSECVELARAEFFARTCSAPMYAFVHAVPKDLDGSMVNDCILLKAEWMPAMCVAAGGRDVG